MTWRPTHNPAPPAAHGMSKPERSLGAFLTATTPCARAQLPVALRPPTTGGPAFCAGAGDAREPRGWDSQRAVHTSSFLFDTEDEAPRGSSLDGAQAGAAGGTGGIHTHSWSSEAPKDPDGDDCDDDDAPNFDALLCLTTDQDRGEAAAVAAADCAEYPASLPDDDDGPGATYAVDGSDEALEVWSPPPRVASQGGSEGGLDVLNETGALPSARRRRRPRSLLHLDSDSSDHGGGGGTQEDVLPCGWADRGGPAHGQPPAKRPAARQPLAQVQPVPLKRLQRRSEEDGKDEGGMRGRGGALPAAAPPQPLKRAGLHGRAIVSESSDGASDDDVGADGEEEEEDEAIVADGSGEDEDGIIMWQEPTSSGEDEDDVAEDHGGGGSEDDPIEVLDDDDDDVAAGAAPLALPAWRARLPHFASVGDIEARRFVLDGAPVYIDYRRQFTGASASRLPAGASGSGPRKAAAPRKKKEAHPDGHWVTEGGRRVFITPSGQRLKGSAAYKAWQKAGGK
jgi:hypothetical protein